MTPDYYFDVFSTPTAAELGPKTKTPRLHNISIRLNRPHLGLTSLYNDIAALHYGPIAQHRGHR